MEKIRKERDHYKLHFNRLQQEKEVLQNHLHEANLKSDQQLNQIKLLNAKVETVLKEKTLSQLDKDKLQSRVKQLEEAVSNTKGTMQKGEKKPKPATIASHNPYLSMTLPIAKSDGYSEVHQFKAHDKGISWYVLPLLSLTSFNMYVV